MAGAETVLLPIYGVSVPFHISVIKNVTNSQDNEHSFVRIIFHSPSAMNVLRDTVLSRGTSESLSRRSPSDARISGTRTASFRKSKR